ncbi:adenylate/guanylate cyclase domain-containing protein [Bradyrhizobium sp. AUGA SZCCT0222]|uniref:adenylate/guanylate cyclase domain-containing protein n=1 Tax=Bradyrhizobium sp. AUGA SZCCT0222 TaxID=2807668 RepID=UPI002012594E|nr:adenylate/guanylate cyclase domain-containing protein [Bradyrhizobium sp. AUGA SZCCT0222]
MASDRVERRLAAVLAVDIAGYSRLMGIDEEGTLARLKATRKSLVDPAIASHRGRIVKTSGDGMLVEFASAVDAALCSIEVQRAMAAQNADVPQDARIEFRIGVHVGDIIIDEGDIFGDGVNIAARLEGIAEPGGVCMSDDAYRQVRGKVDITFEDCGVQILKNIAQPMRAWRTLIGNASGPAAPNRTSSAPGHKLALPEKPSIAVLPFQNMSGDPEQEYFADGMVEDVITALSRFTSLFVIARNSSFAYKGKSPDIRQVGRDLGVRYVLEGSVRKAASRLRITAQLIDAVSGAHVWADRFEGALQDIFALQDEVTEKVVVAIAPRVERAEMARAKRRPAGNTDAYDCYLRGLACIFPVTVESNEQALKLFTEATVLDPDYASAYGMAMFCHANRVGFGVAYATHEKFEVKRLLHVVMQKGNDDGVAFGQAGWASAYVLRDLSSAKPLIDRALELNPNLASAWTSSGWINLWLGHPQVAMAHLDRAVRLDPGSYTSTLMSARAHACFFLDRHEDALAQAEQQLHRNPVAHPALRIAVASAAFAGRHDTAHELAERLRSVDPAFSVSRLADYLGPYQQAAMVEKYREGLRRAGLPA